MSNRLFKRGCRVTILHPSNLPNEWFKATGNVAEIADLRMQFKIEKSLERSPNTAEITITNCNHSTRAELQKKPLIITVAAGYDGNFRHIFTGDLTNGESNLNGIDWETKIQVSDGGRAFQFARITRSYKPGTPVLTLLKDISNALGTPLTPSATQSPDFATQVATGISIQGPARDSLTRLLAPFGFHWSFQSGKLQILQDQNADPTVALVVSQDTGMIGTPEVATPNKGHGSPTLNVKMLLFPEVTPGGSIDVKSARVNGVYRVNKVTHTGDTHGSEWTTQVEAIPRVGAKVA